MILGFPKEVYNKEKRFSLIPKIAKQYIEQGFSLIIEKNAGNESNIDDSEFIDVGAQVVSSSQEVFDSADTIIRINPLHNSEFALIKNESNCLLIFFEL